MLANTKGIFKVRIDRDSSLTDAEMSIVGIDAWNSFCDDVDKAFNAQCISNTLLLTSPFVFLALFIAGCTLCGIANNYMYGNAGDMTWEERDKKRQTGGILIGVSFGYLLIVCPIGALVSCNAHDKVHRVCVDHKTDLVTFKYCDNGGPDYFKIEVKDSNANREQQETFAPAVYVADTQPASAAERLRELENTRGIIDAETYEVMKADIVSSV